MTHEVWNLSTVNVHLVLGLLFLFSSKGILGRKSVLLVPCCLLSVEFLTGFSIGKSSYLNGKNGGQAGGCQSVPLLY